MTPFPPPNFSTSGPLESESDIAPRCRPLKCDNGFEAFIGADFGFTAIDLEPVRLNSNLEFSGAGISTRQASFDKLDIRIWVIDSD